MLLQDYYCTRQNNLVISAEQASLFAKDIAGDFNPLHDPDAKRFCVPGDLLFSLVLDKYGLSQTMHFTFAGMVGDGVLLNFPDTDAEQFDITDDMEKLYLHIERSGPKTEHAAMINKLIRDYVAFSGKTFPYVLVPMLQQENVMFNIDRPMVLYNSMTIAFDRLDFDEPELEILEPKIEVNGKRAEVLLHFRINAAGRPVGDGYKSITISGLREYQDQPMRDFVAGYLARKETYLNSKGR